MAALAALAASSSATGQDSGCLSLDCDTYVGNSNGLCDADDLFADYLYDMAISLDQATGRYSPARDECYKNCHAQFRADKKRCDRESSNKWTFARDHEAYAICMKASQDTLYECLDPFSFRVCPP